MLAQDEKNPIYISYRQHSKYRSFFNTNDFFSNGKKCGAEHMDQQIFSQHMVRIALEFCGILNEIIEEKEQHLNTLSSERDQISSPLAIFTRQYDIQINRIQTECVKIENEKKKIESAIKNKTLGDPSQNIGDIELALCNFKTGFSEGGRDRFYQLFLPNQFRPENDSARSGKK